MTALAHPDAGPVPAAPPPREIVLALPGIRCAGCIAGVEGALRALPGQGTVPLLFLDRAAAPGRRERCAGLGAAGYLVRPRVPGELAAAIESALRGDARARPA